jgi:putative flippase GtrA
MGPQRINKKHFLACDPGEVEISRMHLKFSTLPGKFQGLFRSEKIVWFFFIGVISSLTDLGLFYYFTSFLGIWYLASASFSYCCGLVLSYCLNKYLTFHDKNPDYIAPFSTFAAVSISCLVLNLSIMWVLVEFLSVHYLLAKICGISVGFLWNYYGQSTITFRMNRSGDKT